MIRCFARLMDAILEIKPRIVAGSRARNRFLKCAMMACSEAPLEDSSGSRRKSLSTPRAANFLSFFPFLVAAESREDDRIAEMANWIRSPDREINRWVRYFGRFEDLRRHVWASGRSVSLDFLDPTNRVTSVASTRSILLADFRTTIYVA